MQKNIMLKFLYPDRDRELCCVKGGQAKYTS